MGRGGDAMLSRGTRCGGRHWKAAAAAAAAATETFETESEHEAPAPSPQAAVIQSVLKLKAQFHEQYQLLLGIKGGHVRAASRTCGRCKPPCSVSLPGPSSPYAKGRPAAAGPSHDPVPVALVLPGSVRA